MAQTSVHIKAAKSGALEHNERTRKLDHVRADLTPDNQNWHASGYSGNADLLAEIKADYQEAHGKKLHAKATPVREGVVVIQKDTTMAQLLAAARRCEEEFGVRAKAISMHMDEGHYREGPTPLQNGPWVGNYHAHVTWCWYDWQTHTTCKLTRDDMAAMQTIFAQELGMARGVPSTKKALTAIQYKVQKKQEQLAELEQKGRQATARAIKLQAEIAELQQKEADALEKVEAAEKAASREQFRSNLADAGARVAGLFGRGAMAEAKKDREAKDAAEQEAAEAREAAELAQKAQKQAEFARSAAETAQRTAEKQKAAYGREMYELGVADGIKQGRQSAQASIEPLQQQLADKQAVIDELRTAQDERAAAAEGEVKDMKSWNPNMLNWRNKLADMRQVKMKDDDIRRVFTTGSADVDVPITHNGKQYNVSTTVAMGTTKTAAGGRVSVVLFRFENTWFRVKDFLSKALEMIRRQNPSKGFKIG